MSIDALSWAFNLELPNSGTKLTLLALANYADEEGIAFPSQKAMSKKTCLCERAIRTHLVTLEELGIITRESRTRANGSFTSDLFRINIGTTIASGKICQRQILPAAENDISQRQILPNPAAESAAPDPSLTTSITKYDPPIKPTREKKTSFVLPDWIQKDAWDGFIEMRKQIRKPLTQHALVLTIKELEKIRDDGGDANAALNQSTMNSWQGVFPPKNFQRIRGAPMQSSEEVKREATERAYARLFGKAEKEVLNEAT